MKLLSVVGARPQFIKIAPMCRAIAAYNENADAKVEDIIVHTGQHYDSGMSDVFFEELKIPRADHHLGIGSASHGAQTGRMLENIEQLLQQENPDMVVVYGDTNSTIAGALAASKLHIPVAHIEAGLRSFNKKMPEEINRIVADHISDILLAPTPAAMANLETENLLQKSKNVGDIMLDAVLFNKKLADQHSQILQSHNLTPKQYGIVTIHRAENTDDLESLKGLLDVLNQISEEKLPLIFPIHPRTKNKIKTDLADWSASPNFTFIEPVGYLDMLQLVGNAALALTDSGGLQKEAFFLNCPCVTLRSETEWVETVEAGGNIITGTDAGRIRQAVDSWTEKDAAVDFTDKVHAIFGNGNTAKRILESILAFNS